MGQIIPPVFELGCIFHERKAAREIYGLGDHRNLPNFAAIIPLTLWCEVIYSYSHGKCNFYIIRITNEYEVQKNPMH